MALFSSSFFIYAVISLAILPPLSTVASRPNLQMANEERYLRGDQRSSDYGLHPLIRRLHNQVLPFPFTSARQVPTGPDPLHHNRSPSRPSP